MRTTVTLEPEVYRMLQEQMHRERKTFKEVLNEAIRRGLEPGRPTEEKTPYVVEPHQARLLPGYDPRGFNCTPASTRFPGTRRLAPGGRVSSEDAKRWA
jgi:hypothetical protein